LCISFAFLAFGGCGLLYEIGLTGLGTGLTGFGGTGLTGLCPGLALVQGEHSYVQGSSCLLWWFVLFA
jgi:hypothetical protein